MESPSLECEFCDEEDESGDPEVVAAWVELSTANDKRTRAIAAASSRADGVEVAEQVPSRAPDMVPTMINGGYLVDSDGKVFGRIYSLPQFIPNPSVHVQCSCKDPSHSQCSIWINSSRVPDMLNLRRWIAAGRDYTTSDAHLMDPLRFVVSLLCCLCSHVGLVAVGSRLC